MAKSKRQARVYSTTFLSRVRLAELAKLVELARLDMQSRLGNDLAILNSAVVDLLLDLPPMDLTSDLSFVLELVEGIQEQWEELQNSTSDDLTSSANRAEAIWIQPLLDDFEMSSNLNGNVSCRIQEAP